MVAGLEPVTEGEVRIGGRVVNDLPPKNRDIAMVFQNYALYPHMSAYRNMAFGLKLRKFDKAEIDRRVKSAAEVLGLKDVLGKRPAHSPAASASGLRWAGRSCASRRRFSWTSRCPTSTRSFAWRCVPRSRGSNGISP